MMIGMAGWISIRSFTADMEEKILDADDYHDAVAQIVGTYRSVTLFENWINLVDMINNLFSIVLIRFRRNMTKSSTLCCFQALNLSSDVFGGGVFNYMAMAGSFPRSTNHVGSHLSNRRYRFIVISAFDRSGWFLPLHGDVVCLEGLFLY